MKEILARSQKEKIRKIFFYIIKLTKIVNIIKVNKHKKELNHYASLFTSYPNILFVFQVFNKSKFSKKLLETFIFKKVKNIVAFADGCIDDSANQLHESMKGPNHLVIQVNDVHEIKNYRLSLDIANSLGCEYIFLLQDDDIYQESIFNWLDKAIKIIKSNKISIIGGKSGYNLLKNYKYKKIHDLEKFMKANFKKSKNEVGDKIYEVENFWRFSGPNLSSSNDFSKYEYVSMVTRAPQLIDVKIAKELNFFPQEMEPYQYDDHYNCWKSWINNYKVLLAPFSESKSFIHLSGMRIFNNITSNSRPEHFCFNWNFLLSCFEESLNNGKIYSLVNDANKTIMKE